MNDFLKKHHRLVFYSCWLLLSVMQAGLTELWDDEAYYWIFGQYLDWGYFDHPPMTGLLVKMGYSIFPNELGVRLWPLLLTTFSLMIIEKLIDKKNPFLFYGIALSMAALQIAGFLAVPDMPLIFFTAVFFLFYKRFLQNRSWLNTLLLGVGVALLLYSKYHAVLIVFFTLISNWKLFTRYQTYIAGFIALLLFAPHLYWQYQHDWVSFKYHLFESNVNPYKFAYTTEYIIGQLLLPGPIAGFILLPAAFLYRSKTQLERALKFTLVGIYAFFLLSSFRGRVEGNWTSPVFISLLVLSHNFLLEKSNWQRWLYRTLPFTLVLVLFARIVMIVDIVPLKVVKEKFHSWKNWPAEMKERTKGLPVVFNSSYQRASKYWFYSGQMAYSQNSYQKRKNNFNFWPIEDSLLGKPVYYIDYYNPAVFPDSLSTSIGLLGYTYDPGFMSFGKVTAEFGSRKIKIKEGKEFQLQCIFSATDQYKTFIQSHELNDTMRIGIFAKDGKWQKDIPLPWKLKEVMDGRKMDTLLNPAMGKGHYFMRLGISSGAYPPTHNSEKIELLID